MKRYNAFTIEVTNWENADFWELLSEMTDESCLYDQPNFNKDGIFWFNSSDVTSELFSYSECFNWLSGSVNLWYNDESVTKANYRTVISGEDEEVEYEYLDYNLMTNIAPISDEQN